MPTSPKGQIAYDATDALDLSRQAQRQLACSEILIDSDPLLELAARDLQAVKSLQHQVEERRTAITGPLNQALRAVNDLFRAPKTYLEQAESNLKAAILRYTTAREAQLTLARKEADDAAIEERKRLAGREQEWLARADVEQAAAQAARARAEAAAQRSDLAAVQLSEQEAAQHEVAAAHARAEAAALTQTGEVLTLVPQGVPATVRPAGLSARVTYTAVVTDLPSLIQAVAQGQAPLACLQADTRFLTANARATRRCGPLYPGVELRAERTLASARST